MRGEYPHLPRAPIVEAILDFRVLLPSDFDVQRLVEIRGAIEADYPRFEVQHLMQKSFQFTGEELVTADQRSAIRGYRMLGDADRNIVQFRNDGFTFSRIRPYQSWPAFCAEGWRLWELYRNTAGPHGVTRLATRFINRMEFPEHFTLEDYFTSPPNVPEGVPDVFSSFLQRYVLYPVDDVVASVTLATEKTPDGRDRSSILFDIDCYVQGSVDPDDDKHIREISARLREMQNRIFFRSLTSRALQEYSAT